MKEKIIPRRNKCDYGIKVENHHWLCDKCWGKKEKERDYEERFGAMQRRVKRRIRNE